MIDDYCVEKEFMEQAVRQVDAGPYISQGWWVVGESWLDKGAPMVTLRKRFRTVKEGDN